MIRVIIESPYAGDVDRNVEYARAAMRDSLRRGEAPFASHLLYPQVLDDTKTDGRYRGIRAGLDWGRLADRTVVYEDLGISEGMAYGIEEARHLGRPIKYRSLGDQWTFRSG